ncbi:hypothetical protein [Streptomyces sp. NPDC047315]|uniref:hypothetical protein n=1 Tax=Streptomyces sp. NPDC047315 TaxID=3155142 RepID=UPI0033E0FF2E
MSETGQGTARRRQRHRRHGRLPAAGPAVVSGLVLCTVLLLPAPAYALAVGGPPARVDTLAAANDLTKFYVVKSPEENGGRVDGLADIAGRTLGDPDRFQEILVLNTGRQLPGGEVFVSAEQVVPGFALRLPVDAEGADVQFGALPDEAGQQGPQQQSGNGTQSPTGAAAPLTNPNRSKSPLDKLNDQVPLPLLFGGIAGVAALTVAIIARRKLARGLRALGRGIAAVARVLRPRLPRPMALALLRRRRAALARRLAADTRTPVVIRSALDELVRTGSKESPTRVYTVRAAPSGLTAAVSGAGRAPAPWTAIAPNDWRREGLPSALAYNGAAKRTDAKDPTGIGELTVIASAGAAEGEEEPESWAAHLTLPHLARVGVDPDGAQVMVGLGQINGALSVRGDLRVAGDTVTALAHGLLELPWQNTVVVAVDPDASALPGLHGVVRVRSVAEVRDRAPAAVFEAAEDLGLGLVRSATGRGEVTGFLLVLRPPNGEEARALAELTSPRGGWTVLTVGDVPGAHWRWYAEPEGTVDLGVLGLRVTVPAPLAAAGDRI